MKTYDVILWRVVSQRVEELAADHVRRRSEFRVLRRVQFNRYRLSCSSSMTNPGVTPSLLALTTRHCPLELGGVLFPGPRFRSSIDIRLKKCRFVYHALFRTSPRVFASSARPQVTLHRSFFQRGTARSYTESRISH